MTGRRLERGDPYGAVSDLATDLAVDAPVPTWRDAVASRRADEGGVLVVDEAQWLDDASQRVVVGVAERAGDRGLTVVVAHRPVTGDADLAALDAVRHAPELALGWYERAIASGLPAATVARRAEAAALTGDAIGALRLADEVVAGPPAPERRRALAVVAALLPGRGLWRRSAAACSELAGAADDDPRAAVWPVLAGGACWRPAHRPLPPPGTTSGPPATPGSCPPPRSPRGSRSRRWASPATR